MLRFPLAVCAALVAVSAHAEVKSQSVDYKQGSVALEGFVAAPDGAGKKPAVIIVHEWDGLGDYVKGRAQQVAGLGYVAFAADVYGKGVHPTDPKEMGALAGKYKGDRPLLRARVNAALDELLKRPDVDPKKIAVMGYCFGGTAALELARSGAPLVGTVSFHGGLGSPTPADAKNIKGKVLALHGADDPTMPSEEVSGFEKEMRDARVDWELVKYGGAVHAFTNPAHPFKPGAPVGYNEAADKRSWTAMRAFFDEVFR